MPNVTVYDLDDTLSASVTFSVNATNTDPTAVTFDFRSPSGTVTNFVFGVDSELQKLATGIYEATFSVTEGGRWWYRWEGTGTAPGVEQGYIEVDYDRVS
jgi:hypothetical protein